MENKINAPAIQTVDLTKRYPRGNTEFDAVSHLDLTVGQGDFVAIMGASGSGKSTALNLIAGLTRPTSGDVLIDGRSISKMGDRALTLFRRRHMGIVFQSYNLIPHLTAEENILFPLRADGRKIDGIMLAKMHDLFEELEIVQQLNQYPDALSGGQQQRVTLARALAADPVALLADEPTGNLDWTTSQNICRFFDKLNREEGRTIVVVTHEPAVAVWAKRVVVLRDGKIAGDYPVSQFADAAELAAAYQEIARRTDEK